MRVVNATNTMKIRTKSCATGDAQTRPANLAKFSIQKMQKRGHKRTENPNRKQQREQIYGHVKG